MAGGFMMALGVVNVGAEGAFGDMPFSGGCSNWHIVVDGDKCVLYLRFTLCLYND